MSEAAALTAEEIAVIERNTTHPKAWAIRLRDRERAQRRNPGDYGRHELMTQAQRHMWRQALGLELNTEA
jgi:hypothetical protein